MEENSTVEVKQEPEEEAQPVLLPTEFQLIATEEPNDKYLESVLCKLPNENVAGTSGSSEMPGTSSASVPGIAQSSDNSHSQIHGTSIEELASRVNSGGLGTSRLNQLLSASRNISQPSTMPDVSNINTTPFLNQSFNVGGTVPLAFQNFGVVSSLNTMTPDMESFINQHVPSLEQIEEKLTDAYIKAKSKPRILSSSKLSKVRTAAVSSHNNNTNASTSSMLSNLPNSVSNSGINGPQEPSPMAEASTSAGKGKKSKGHKAFNVDTALLNAIPTNQQDSELQSLGLTVFNQDEFEQGVMGQIDQAIEQQEKEERKHMKEKELQKLQDEIKSCQTDLEKTEKALKAIMPYTTSNKEARREMLSIKSKKDAQHKQLKSMKAKRRKLTIQLTGSVEPEEDEDPEEETSDLLQQTLSGETETNEERMIRLGEMTPFGTVVSEAQTSKSKQSNKSNTSTVTDFGQFLMDQGSKPLKKKKPLLKRSSTETVTKYTNREPSTSKAHTTHSKAIKKSSGTSKEKDKFLSKQAAVGKLKSDKDKNYFDAHDKRRYRPDEADFSNYKPKKRRLYGKLGHNFSGDGELSDVEYGDEHGEDDYYRQFDADGGEMARDEQAFDESQPIFKPKRKKRKKVVRRADDSDASWSGEEDSESSSEDIGTIKSNYKRKTAKGRAGMYSAAKDDGNVECYERRLREQQKIDMARKQERLEKGEADSDDESDVEFSGGYKLQATVWNKLYRYQKTGVKWLWELHQQQCGGIVGDEMGLGKTIQTVAFLRGLRYSKLRDKGTKYRGLGASIIVCPTTVLHQWVKEFHTWWPDCRVAILHSSGSYTNDVGEMIHDIYKHRGVIVTAYSSIVIYQEQLLQYEWHYIVLDEGHKIRNPDAQATMACKQFRTPHRIILSGSPIQNNLKELWSLFDFVFPGKLGTLPDFMTHFSVPIVQGGYANATDVQVQTAYKCACVLRDTINPYLLRRMKADVKNTLQLPAKNEQVLFCRLTEHQKDVYQEYLDSKECSQILKGQFMVFPGLITLRKVCNHPDLSTGGPRVFGLDSVQDDNDKFGYWRRSGKMIVIESLLKLWHKQGHRVLLFSQGTQMLDVMEDFVQDRHYKYLRMDGRTTIGSRQALINKFNQESSYFVFLLTTRVGGLGVNLTGADRVVIFDPDWNPSTDLQARERAWRIGQKKQVTIYRLLTAGTIEEKIYHRQIFKQFLTNRVLKDPKQRRFFKSNDLYELFTLTSDDPNLKTETSAIFAGTGSDVRVRDKDKDSKEKTQAKKKRKNRFDVMKEEKQNLDTGFEEDIDEEKSQSEIEKLNKMKELARKLSAQMSSGAIDKSVTEEIKSFGCVTVEEEDGKGKEGETEKKGKKDKGKKKKRHKEKKRKRDAVFEGEKISHLAGHDEYQGGNKDEKEDPAHDDFVLKRLLKKSGVHSAMQHDKIMMSSNPDYVLVESEADRVAKEAAAALKASRRRLRDTPVGVPTWTGASGAAGAPQKPRFGKKKSSNPIAPAETKSVPSPTPKKEEEPLFKPDKVTHFDGSSAGRVVAKELTDTSGSQTLSANQLLSKMRQRNHLLLNRQAADLADEDVTESARNEGAIHAEPNPAEVELITDIRNFIAFGAQIDGQATTQEILDQFLEKVPKSDSAKFKAMLGQICSLNKREGVGIWRLLPEFR